MSTKLTVSRRSFAASGGALIVGFFLPFANKSAHAKAMKGPFPAEVSRALDAWISVGSDNTVTLYTGKVDLGTGVQTALAQIAAEELDIRMQQLRVVQGDTKLTPDQGPTWASITVTRGGSEVRLASANARAALLDLAAKKLSVDVSTLSVDAGIVSSALGAKITYGELVAGSRFEREIDPKVRVKSASEYRIVGKSVPRIDIPAKVSAAFTFVQDIKVPGMLHGRTVSPPRLGATLKSVDDRRARRIHGFVQLVREQNFIGVVASSEWAAVRASRELNVQWEGGQPYPTTAMVYSDLLATTPAATQQLVKTGDTAVALKDAAHVVEAVFEAPYQTHGSIGPSCAVADVSTDGVTVWSATQAPHFLQVNLAELLGIPEDKVRVIYIEGAGCYGRNGHEDAAGDAVLLSRAMKRPVRVQWMRHQEHGSAPMGPAQIVKVRAGLSADGKITAWETDGWYTELPKDFPPVHMSGFRAAGYKQDEIGFAGYVHSNQQPIYAVPNQRVTAIRAGARPVRVSWIRAPGRIWNVFAVECVMDELAKLAKIDDVAFRLQNTVDPRARQVIERVARISNWQPNSHAKDVASNVKSPIMRGRGFSYARYSNSGAYIAMVADVAVERSTGVVSVERIFVSHDCGLMVNPDGVLNQVQGCVIQTASRTLYEEMGFDGQNVTTLDWASYPIMRFSQVPELVIDLVASKDAPMGVGEAATAPVPSAIVNAVFDATGIRFKRLPLTPERVKTALR
jgi:nicotinate dehydrogenase subunit B